MTRLIFPLIVALGLVGCNDDKSTDKSVDTPPTSQPAEVPGNTIPTLSGTASPSAVVGSSYSFQPTAHDASADSLVFSIQNKPTWANFNTNTGLLSGTPASSNVGKTSNIIIAVTDGTNTVALPAFAISVLTGSSGAPVIAGTPNGSVTLGMAYSFAPITSDPNGDALTFSIQNKPVWASFNTSSGQLSGTPTIANVGTYQNIVISVSDGKATATLNAFSIAVTQIGTGSATLSWIPPTQNTDGSALTNLAGYRIHYGTSAGSLSQTALVSSAGVSTFVVNGLSAATWFFEVKAYTSDNIESDSSAVVSKRIM